MRKVRITITLYSSTQKSHRGPLLSSNRFYGCPVFFKGINELSSYGYGCRIYIDGYGKTIHHGEMVHNLEMAFLNPELVMPWISCGSEFLLWEAGFIGEGVITDILPQKYKKRMMK